jgi:hypothetical protein
MSDQSTTPVEYRSLDFLGYPGYRVGDDGSVWRMCTGRRLRGIWRQLKPIPVGRPRRQYRNVALTSKNRHCSIHRLVLMAFVGPCPPGCQTRHKNGNSADNRLVNLAWGTPKENCADKILHGTSQCGERGGRAKLTEADVREIRRLAAEGYAHAVIATRFPIAQQTVTKIVLRQNWAHVS